MVRDMLFQNYVQGIISDDEPIIVLEENTAGNPEFNFTSYNRFELDDMDTPECKANFRFEKHDLPVLAEALYFRCSQRTVGDQVEGLCQHTTLKID